MRCLDLLFLAALPIVSVVAQAPVDGAARAAGPWVLRGRVVAAEDKTPLAGCTVGITGHQATGYPLHWSWLGWCDPPPVLTGPDGRFEFRLPAQPGRGMSDGYPSRVHLTLRADARVGLFGSFQLSQFFGEPVQDVGDLALPRGVQTTVRVVDGAGAPQQGAVVQLAPEPPPARTDGWYWLEHWKQSEPAGADGRIVFESAVAPGTYKLKAINRRFSAGEATLVIDAATRVDGAECTIVAKLATPVATASGRVVDAEGKPVAGFRIGAVFRVEEKEDSLSTRTDADGTFRFTTFQKPVASEFGMKHDANDRYDGEPMVGTGTWGRDDLVVTLARPAALDLLVRGPAGLVVEELSVHAVPLGALPGADPVRIASNFVGGHVRLAGLREGRWSVRVHARGSGLWPSDWLEFDASAAPETRTIELPAAVERALHVLTEQGRPVVDATIELVLGEKGHLQKAMHSPDPSWWQIYHCTMTGQLPRERIDAVIADNGRTDRSGKVTLRCVVTKDPVCVVLRPTDAPPIVCELPAWSEGRGALTVTVPDGGSVVGTVVPADFGVVNDVSTDKERTDAAKNGPGRDPWRRSSGDLRATHRPGVVLVPAGATPPYESPVAVFADDGSFSFERVPPGRYEAHLVMRRRDGNQVVDEPVGESMGVVEVLAGERHQLPLTVPAALLPKPR